MPTVPGILLHSTTDTGMAKDIAAAAIEWKKGDRVLIRFDDDEYYVGTITKIAKNKAGRKRLYLTYDDGEKENLSPASKYIFGKTDYKRRRVRHFTKQQAQDILADKGDVKKRTEKEPVKKPRKTRNVPINWMKGDRIIIQWDDGYYLGTVFKVGDRKLDIRYDSGEDGQIAPNARRILGISDERKRRAGPFSEKKAHKILRDKGAPQKRTAEDTTEKPSFIDPLQYHLEKEQREADEKFEKQRLEMEQLFGDTDSIYKQNPGSIMAGVIHHKDNTASVFIMHPNDLQGMRTISMGSSAEFYFLIGAEHSKKWSNKLQGAVLVRPKRISRANLKALMEDSVAWADRSILKSMNVLNPTIWKSGAELQRRLAGRKRQRKDESPVRPTSVNASQYLPKLEPFFKRMRKAISQSNEPLEILNGGRVEATYDSLGYSRMQFTMRVRGDIDKAKTIAQGAWGRTRTKTLTINGRKWVSRPIAFRHHRSFQIIDYIRMGLEFRHESLEDQKLPISANILEANQEEPQ